ncbi:F-box domain-containing protein [Mycena venus]|uniref:F-box domain-containing protein n=1 Tax=Mycena venus TaxID=2733690 RepID=A0A8H7D862_9AGAR|nr:F-box domain-containing protein [Mycena venus]
MTLLHKLPADVILEVVDFLELPDPLSLLLTCSSLYSLSNGRSFWISILETTRRKSPIACPLHADLSQYTLETLKGLVVSWMRLQKNWGLPFPQIVHPMTSTRLTGPAQILANVQGTDILILNMGRNVVCWDPKLATPYPFPAIEVGVISLISVPVEVPGVCTIALLAEQTQDTANRHVITIKHEERKAISFTTEFSEISVFEGDLDSLILTEDVVGTIVTVNGQEDCIVAVSAANSNVLLSDSTSVLKLNRLVDTNQNLMDCFSYKGHLYSLLEDGVSVQIQHIPRKSLHSGHCEDSSRYISDLLFPEGGSLPLCHPFCSLMPSTPLYGISAIFVHLEWDGESDDAKDFTSFTFVPNTLTHASDDGVSSPLAFDSPSVTEYVPGTIVDLNLVWADHAGCNVLVVIRDKSAPPGLLLVRYHPETKTTSVHTLAVPEAIHLKDLNGLCVDDTAGTVYLLDREGLFSTLRYV